MQFDLAQLIHNVLQDVPSAIRVALNHGTFTVSSDNGQDFYVECGKCIYGVMRYYKNDFTEAIPSIYPNLNSIHFTYYPRNQNPCHLEYRIEAIKNILGDR
ncbi:MAG: hypothetical protein AAF383_05300 [Cyanobacteria bacterium P01_A01_bin.83]